MPLLDHFHPPLEGRRHWESFHGMWAARIADSLNLTLLPPGYFAEIQVHVGRRIEVDIATFEEERSVSTAQRYGTTATATLEAPAWAPPTLVMPALFPDDIEVQVYSSEGGPTLVAAVELISPGNKDRDEARRAFAAKCSGYLQRGIGLVLIDIVTNRRGNLHDELVRLLGYGDEFLFPSSPSLYAVAYRPLRRDETNQTEVWLEPEEVGKALPTLPLALR
ncbi:MAG TPA: DUF4058 family protein, partial [Isosphaeraceae bacterium]